jgi:hypothetical protein
MEKNKEEEIKKLLKPNDIIYKQKFQNNENIILLKPEDIILKKKINFQNNTKFSLKVYFYIFL